MDIAKVVAELRAELARVNAAIQSLEQLERGVPRRGRPPGWLQETRTGTARNSRSKRTTVKPVPST
jgi:hypothetical protein